MREQKSFTEEQIAFQNFQQERTIVIEGQKSSTERKMAQKPKALSPHQPQYPNETPKIQFKSFYWSFCVASAVAYMRGIMSVWLSIQFKNFDV